MLAYLTIGLSVEVAWNIFCAIRKMPSAKDVKGFGMWMGYLFWSAISIIIWPIMIVGYTVVSYNPDLLNG